MELMELDFGYYSKKVSANRHSEKNGIMRYTMRKKKWKMPKSGKAQAALIGGETEK